MQTLFGRLSWHRAIETLRRRRPKSPIRHGDINPLRGLDRLRLDDRIAPGSVFGTAAAQAIGLAGPLARIGLDGTNMLAAPPAPVAESLANVDGDPGDLGLPDASSSFFSFTAPDAIPPVGSANQQLFASVGDPSAGVSLTDLGEPGSQMPISPVSAGSVAASNATPPAGGGTSNFAAPNVGAIRSGGFVVSGGLPTPMPPNTGGGAPSPAPHGAGDKATAAPAAPSGSLSTIGSTPAPQPIAAPAGHFATQLQALFHSGDTGGTFNLSDTANQQSQIGALVGSQLTNATGLNSADAASHRPASLLGQTLADGSNQNLGLRTSDSSSGMFGLVGSQSIGDLVDGPTAGNQGGLANAANAVASAIPAACTLPGIGAQRITNGVDRAAGLPGAVLTNRLTPSADSGDGSGMRMATNMDETEPPPDSADFLLTVEGGNPNYDQDGIGSPPWSITEQGSIVFLSMEPGNGDYGPGYLQTELDATVNIDEHGSYGSLGMDWTGYATPAGMLYGFDIDQFNQQEFGIDDSTATSYTLDTWGNDSTTAPDASSTQNQQTGTVTRQESDVVTNQNMGENFSLHVEGPAYDHQATWDNTITSGFNGAEYGTDVDSTDPTVAPSTNDGFTDTDTETTVEVDHTEGTIEPDGTFQLTSFSTDITSDDDYIDYIHGITHAPEPGGSETDNSYDEDIGDDHEHLVISGSPDSWTTTLDDTDQSYFSDGDTSNESSLQTNAGETDANRDSFNTGDGGTHTDTLHIDGVGDATTFTANNVSDRIEDVYNFNDADINNPVDTTTTATDQDTDNYHFSDNGNADEVLTINGDANNLTASYADTVHDGFTDSDDIHDQWNGPDSADTGSDSGNDHSTDGDSGSETVNLSASASLANWQSDSSSGDTPTWQISNVTADLTGTGDAQSHDSGLDTDATGPDSQADQFTDTSTAAETFGAHLTGDGSTASLSQTATLGLTTHTEDDTTLGWDDPSQLNGETADDAGAEQVDVTGDDTPTVTVSWQGTVAADGTVTPTSGQADVQDTLKDSDRVHETVGGSELIADQSATVTSFESIPGTFIADDPATWESGLDQQSDSINETTDLRQTTDMHAATAADGTTAITADENDITGSMSLGSTEDDTDTENPDDMDGDDEAAQLGVTVKGDMHQTGTATPANGVTAQPATGQLDVGVTGTVTDPIVKKYHANHGTEPGDPTAAYPVPSGDLSVAAELYWPEPITLGSPLPPAGPADVTVTSTTTVTLTDLDEQMAAVIGCEWAPTGLGVDLSVTTKTTYSGHYTNTLLVAGGTGDGSGGTTDTVSINVSGPPDALTGTVTTRHNQWEKADPDLEGGPVDGDGTEPSFTGTAHVDGNTGWSQTQTGTFHPGADGATNVTKLTRREWGKDTLTYHIEAVDAYGATLVEDYQKADGDNGGESHKFYDDGTAASGQSLGTDSYTVTFHSVYTSPSTIADDHDSYLGTANYVSDGSGGITRTVFPSDHAWGTTTDVATGQVTPYSSTTGAPNALDEGQWWRASAPFTSAPDFNPDSIGSSGPVEGLTPIWGPGRDTINDLQNGRVASAVKNGALTVLDATLVGGAVRWALEGLGWAGGKAAVKAATGGAGELATKAATGGAAAGARVGRTATRAGNLQWHHIWPRRFGYPPQWFWDTFPGRGQVLLPTGKGLIHTLITNAWDQALRKGGRYNETEIKAVLVQILKQFPLDGFPYR